MYHPYFRGKQYELITIRETADQMARSDFVPIVEPVKEALSGLQRTLEAVCDANGNAVVIVNPYYGDHVDGGGVITQLLQSEFVGKHPIGVGVLLREDMTTQAVIDCCVRHRGHGLNLIHAGFNRGDELARTLAQEQIDILRNVFVEAYCGKLYTRHFRSGDRILVRDGFKRQRNRDYPPQEFFSDLHITYEDEGMDGFGDFLIVGDDYSETGGPAYAVAIHLTFIDPEKENAMFIYHFKSDSQDTPTDPAGKFGEALAKMIRKLDTGRSNLAETSAVREFRQLHRDGHFPGLGYVKKLSMKHHIETLAGYFARQ